MLTTTQWRGRRLGKSEIVEVPNDATWVATGNNVELSDELARRTVPIRLDPGVERPEQRTGFAHPELLSWVRAHRATLVSACLSIIQAWIHAGCPDGNATPGSYESWARIMGGVLVGASPKTPPVTGVFPKVMRSCFSWPMWTSTMQPPHSMLPNAPTCGRWHAGGRGTADGVLAAG